MFTPSTMTCMLLASCIASKYSVPDPPETRDHHSTSFPFYPWIAPSKVPLPMQQIRGNSPTPTTHPGIVVVVGFVGGGIEYSRFRVWAPRGCGWTAIGRPGWELAMRSDGRPRRRSYFGRTRSARLQFAGATLENEPVRARMTFAAVPQQQTGVGLDQGEGMTLRARGELVRLRLHWIHKSVTAVLALRMSAVSCH